VSSGELGQQARYTFTNAGTGELEASPVGFAEPADDGVQQAEQGVGIAAQPIDERRRGHQPSLDVVERPDVRRPRTAREDGKLADDLTGAPQAE
jgi:hypothetical protein